MSAGSIRECTQELFAEDVRHHQMTVVQANGVHRHLQFKRPGTSVYRFNIITWPGSLCIEGDMGCYVLSRLHDMFDFFRTDRGAINQSYWAEKVVSQCRTDGLKEFCQASFVRHAVETYREHWRGRGAWSDQLEGFKALRMDVLDAEDEGDMHRRLRDFSWKGFEFHDSWEWQPYRYTFRFIWCLRAIAWAIQQWDEKQTEASVA